MAKIIFFEGLPGSGKSTITNYFDKKYAFCERIGEVINSKGEEVSFEKHFGKKWDYFVKSDITKIKLSEKSKKKIFLVDRGFLSTLSHGFVRKERSGDKDFDFIINKFKRKLNLNNNQIFYVYLKNTPEKSLFRSKHPKTDIWGVKENLEKTALFYEIYFLFRKNVFIIDSGKLPLNECKLLCDKIVLRIRDSV